MNNRRKYRPGRRLGRGPSAPRRTPRTIPRRRRRKPASSRTRFRRSKNGCPAFVGRSAVVTHIGDGCRAAGFLPIAMAVKCTKLDRSGRARIADCCHRLLAPDHAQGPPWSASHRLFQCVMNDWPARTDPRRGRARPTNSDRAPAGRGLRQPGHPGAPTPARSGGSTGASSTMRRWLTLSATCPVGRGDLERPKDRRPTRPG